MVFCSCGADDIDYDEPIQIWKYNPSSEYIAVFGDIQYLTNTTHNYLFKYSCDWIVAKKHEGMKINSVLQVGDVTQHNKSGHWKSFESAVMELSQEIPFISAIGDHDYTWGEDGITITDRNKTKFSKYLGFPLTNQRVVDCFEEGHMENVVVKNTIHGLPIYFLVLEFGPRKEIVEWAGNYVKGHPNINFILINHEYLEAGGGRRVSGLKCELRFENSNTTYTTPSQLWDDLIRRNDNILCVLCGHVGGLYAYTQDKNDFGREVPQIQHNIQSEEFRFDNWLMLWEFPKENDFVNVSIVNTKSMKYYDGKSVLFKFEYKNCR